jgi:hypothetical protein
VFLELVQGDGAARLHVLQSLADAFEYLGLLRHLAELLVGGRILDDQLGLTVDGQNDRLSGLLQMPNEVCGVLLEVGHRVDIAAEVQHGSSRRES